MTAQLTRGGICNQYAEKDSRIKVLQKKNGGVSSARNLGMEAAEGEYIMFCDGDDCVHSRWIESLYGIATTSENILCVCAVERGENPSFDEYESEANFYPISYFEMFIKGISGYTWNKIYFKSIIKKYSISFDELIIVGEDVLFNVEYMKHCKGIMCTDLPLYYYFRNPESVTNRYQVDRFQQHLMPFRCRIPLIDQIDLPSYCDIWLCQFLDFFRNIFDGRNTMNIVQKLKYNQRMMNSAEFRFCVSHATGKKENPLMMKIVRLHNYYLLWLFDRLVELKNRK